MHISEHKCVFARLSGNIKNAIKVEQNSFNIK